MIECAKPAQYAKGRRFKIVKKLTLALMLLILALSLVGCAAVNSENSFQNQAPGEVTVTQSTQNGQNQQNVTQQEATEPTAVPTQDPNSAGYNG